MKNISSLLISLSMLIPLNSYAFNNPVNEFDRPDYELNTDTCVMTKNNNLGVCIENKTGEIIRPGDLYFSEYASYRNNSGSGSSDKPVKLEQEVNLNKFINIQFSLERFLHMNPSEKYDDLTISIHPGQSYYSVCNFTWHKFSPPYSQPAKLILEKTKDGYRCHWDGSADKNQAQ